ncbi:hypothetical protein B0A49_03153 [Cryomyces minteri]|uniref:Uncharacterized protein n=1 Tax=Cryomyces minteri TaxID=331657 RepID=A0A4U0XF39_9PEZI|nr:hypothetical protein B0A49_03153 [Cryomyces minteri]
MSEGPPSRHGHSGLLDDGWARIVWIGNSHTLMVCSRRQITILDIHSNPVRLKCPELGIARTAHWFLDVRSSPIHKDHVFILTSSNLFWLQVTTLEEQKNNNRSNAIAKVLLSWKHFRSDEDPSLRLSVTADEDDMLILISSRLNTLVTSFRLSMPPYPHAIPLSLSDPAEVMLSPSVVPSSTSEVGVMFAINSLSLWPLQYCEYNGNLLVNADGPGHSYKQLGVRFYSMTVLSESLGVTQRLYYVLPVTGRQVEHDSRLTHDDLGTKALQILAPTWQDKSVRSTYRVHEDDFIVEDGFEDEDEDDFQMSVPVVLVSPRVKLTDSPSDTFSDAITDFKRLRQYTTFSKATPPPPLPKPLSTVLSHWTLGADPAEYDWAATRQALESESRTANEMSEAERARIARKAAKLLKRQRRETAAAEAATAASQQGPVVMASQPVGPSGRWSSPAPLDAGSQLVGPGVQSSQLTQSQRLPASQVEPGRHGGRQRHTARGAPAKKKRAEGFR